MVRCQGAAPRCGDLFGQGDEEGKKIKQKKKDTKRCRRWCLTDICWFHVVGKGKKSGRRDEKRKEREETGTVPSPDGCAILTF